MGRTAWGAMNRHQWGKTRTIVLQRDSHTCQLGLPGCTRTAEEVDHIIPISQGGNRYDPNNCRAVCRQA